MQTQLFKADVQMNVIKQDPTDYLQADDLFFIQKLVKMNFKTEEILIKFELQEKQYVYDYIQRLRRIKWNLN